MISEKEISKQKKVLYTTISIFAFLLIWQLATMLTKLGLLLPSPIETFTAFFQSFVEPIGQYCLYTHVFWSLTRVIPFYLIGAFIGIVCGITMGWYKPVEAIVRPLFELVRPIPPLAWIPIAIVWFGIGEGSKWFLIFLASFCNVTINAYSGAKSVDPILVGCSRMLGASDTRIFTSVVLPSSVPHIFAGLQTALSVSWATVVAAEMIRSTEGVGWIIINSQETNNVVNTLVGVVAIGIVGFVLAIIMRGLEAKLCRWTKRGI